MPTEKRARQRANRQAARQAAAARQKRSRTLRTVRTALIVASIVLVAGFLFSRGRGSGDATTTTTTDAATTSTPTTTLPAESLPEGAVDSAEYTRLRSLPVACGGTRPPPATAMSFSAPGDADIAQGSTVTATIETSCGPIVLELDPDGAPQAVNSFVFLARQGYFDGIVSHRIFPGFVFQIGDPTATGGGGPGYEFSDEPPPAGFTYTRGTVAMANSGPDTNGSQFFIVFQDSPQLPPDYTVFGKVVDGLDVLDSIERVEVQGNDDPLEGVYLDRVEITVG